MFDGQQLGETIVAQVKGYLEREVAPLKAENADLKQRIAALEARPAAEKGEAGENGSSPEPEAVAAAFLPIAEELIAAEVDKAVAALPPPEKGEQGDPGERGEPGERGADGTNGADGNSGADGRGVKDLLIDRDGQLIATMDDGEMKELGVIVGKDGRDGKDGEQGDAGFSLDDFDIERGDDGRTFTLKFERGDTRHSYEMTFPAPVYCGVYKEAEQYVPGDLVTWGGSLWHCDKETSDKPGTDSWTLAVKKGRDGKDAKGG